MNTKSPITDQNIIEFVPTNDPRYEGPCEWVPASLCRTLEEGRVALHDGFVEKLNEMEGWRNDKLAYISRLEGDYERLKTQLRLSEEHAGTMAKDFDASLAVVREANKEMGEAIEKIANHLGFKGTAPELAEAIRMWVVDGLLATQDQYPTEPLT